MRYRPFSRTGMALSAISLELCGEDAELGPAEWRDLVHAAFEEGVNAFELVRPTPDLLQGFADGAAAVERGLIFIGLRIADAADPASLADLIAEAMAKAGLKTLDLLTLEASPDQPVGVPAVLRALRDHGLVRRLAIAGAGDAIEPYVQTGGFDALKTPFNLLSGWRERHLIRTAVDRQMGVIGLDPCPPEVATLVEEATAQTKPGWFKKASPLAGVGSYAFLQSTAGWSPEQLCLGYALTEPSVATVQAKIADREALAELAQVADRDLPAAVAAQIEMARFSAERETKGDDQRERRSA
jgi:aryl-alcohol dehydrogenase-like predicted oxidoreductase